MTQPLTLLTADDLDDITVDLVFALRDSLTEDVSRLDFWQGRAATAIETAAAGGEAWPQAVTIAARKLQIPQLALEASKTITKLGGRIEGHYSQWQAHVARNLVYIVALARVENTSRKTPKPDPEPTTDTEEAIF
ncbi:hypothetical protein GCM10009785_35260 [Brooklawnia cerclae]|uniref:Uncharacterized protein n=1 Tax=Brooklawnia cerclae TaxID=349934 RepID=A0ABX0SG02_9ACTN|nr:hypothetical protein [Brooklawnia cerclae]NIH57289.1 hypothetical protein [Brooklawnia cerclae]NIH58502.1 hypothetical protein [Brooklawnia cerclae]